HGVYHRALAPSAVLVTAGDEDTPPRIRITNWHAGARVSQGPDGTVVAGTAHAHVSAIAASDIDVYRAPEAAQPDAKPQRIDVFGLGALALLILTGKPPAASARQLRQTLDAVGYLDPTAVADAVDPELADLVIEATQADPSRRSASMDDVLIRLDFAEESWAEEELDYEPNPLDARRDAVIGRDRFKVIARLGRGATAIALRRGCRALPPAVRSQGRRRPRDGQRPTPRRSQLARRPQHPAIVQLLEEPLDLSGHVSSCCPTQVRPTTPTAPPRPAQRTLATHLASTKVGVELVQRWGEDLLDALRYLEQMGRSPRHQARQSRCRSSRRQGREHLVLFDFSLASASIEALEAGTLAISTRSSPSVAAGTRPPIAIALQSRSSRSPPAPSPATATAPPTLATSMTPSMCRRHCSTLLSPRRYRRSSPERSTETSVSVSERQMNVLRLAASLRGRSRAGDSDRAHRRARRVQRPRWHRSCDTSRHSSPQPSRCECAGECRDHHGRRTPPSAPVSSALPGAGSKTRTTSFVAHSLLGDALGEEPDVDDTETTDDSASGQLSLPGYDEQRAGELGAVAAQAVPTSKRKDQQTQIALAASSPA
ncbi:MAG: hypothetical protein R2710_25880, partial [Acidimicrobiales bacterium]